MAAPLVAILVAFLLLSGVAQGAEIKVLASGAMKEAYLALLPAFEKESGHKVTLALSSTTEIQKQISAGEIHDLVILGDNGTEKLIHDGKLVGGTRAVFAKSGISIAVRAGAPKPDVGSADALKKTLLAAKSVGYSAGASGTYLVGMFQKLGIYDQVKAKATIAGNNVPVGDKVAAGETEIGFQQLSELMPVKGIDIIAPLPADLQHFTVFSGAIHSAAKEKEAASALIRFLTAPATQEALKKFGLEPG
ncbi:MAG: molybdate ABC transporter substrate-binding protein [Alphaproteobacteria bacterium]|nr:molybdate ABC transporter substrate-binding protein [Alphaproteobacteria bacterium]